MERGRPLWHPALWQCEWGMYYGQQAPGIRAGLAFQTEVAKLIRQHNDANIICIPARFVALEYAKEMVDIFINTPFEGGRHQTRVDKIACN